MVLILFNNRLLSERMLPDAAGCTLQAWFSGQVDEREIPILGGH